MKISSLLALLSPVLASSLWAMDATWAKSDSYDLDLLWNVKANWLVGGVQPDDLPTNAADNVVFPHVTTKRRQSVYAGGFPFDVRLDASTRDKVTAMAEAKKTAEEK